MAELDLFRGFRSGVAPPTEAARRRAAAWEAQPTAPRMNVLRYSAVAFAALTTVTAAALFLSTPWNDSPGFLERAEAALTGDPSTVLHAKWQLTAISQNPACVHTGAPNEIWVDQRPPHRYRAILGDYPDDVDHDPRVLICEDKGTVEVGGTLDERAATSGTIAFEPPNTLSQAPVHFRHAPDEAERLVEAIAQGRAHDEGETQLDGRAVHRIRLEPDPPSECPYSSCPDEPTYAFVDAETFVPVEIHGRGLLLLPDGPIWFRGIVRYHTYEYLPRTPANLALTDLRAQHPDAIER